MPGNEAGLRTFGKAHQRTIMGLHTGQTADDPAPQFPLPFGMRMPFDFQPWPLRDPADHLVVKVPAGIRRKADLFATLAQGGEFPAGFAHNWDSLSSCLLDLGWVRQPRVAVVHDDVPLNHQLQFCRTYLQILLESVQAWRRREAQVWTGIAPVPAGKQARLRVVFPRSAFAQVHKRLNWEII